MSDYRVFYTDEFLREHQAMIEAERILAMSDDAIEAECRAEGRDPEQIATECRAIYERAIEIVDGPIRTGDTVLHRPSCERWIVAYVHGEYLAWCGWPEGEAHLADCERVNVCTDNQHWEWVKRIAGSASGTRAWHCQQMLAEKAGTL